MIHLNKIALDFEPRKKFFSKLATPPLYREPEMNEFESAFLCGLIKKFCPKKIIEIGVAGGATTAIILECLESIGQKYEMISVDIAQNFYRDTTKKTGFLAESITEDLKFGTHKFCLGTTLPFVIDDIGADIDFVILDTMHIMPGENLDFLVALPYLTKDAVVCLHDISLNQTSNILQHATTSLFAAVTADKFLNLIPRDDHSLDYPNIAAFQINSDTMKNIENIFLTLILRWIYMPSSKDLKGYAEMFTRHYSPDLSVIFMQSIRMNYENLVKEVQAKQR